ncbi:MAG: YhcH/YjgK/YiaL family protein [Candidatus Latescibacteria bacterium]|nr:YhcH/YjgK/YiaL family protein [Candidatus Latescibacterota bacterium]
MILDCLENAERYYSLNPGFKKAFEFLKTNDLQNLEGTIEIDGDRVYAMVIRAEGEGHEGAQLEFHKRYLDIQFCVGGLQEFGWKPKRDCTAVTRPFDAGDDYGFFGDEPDTWIPVKPGQFAIFFPEDAHTPKGGKGSLHKVLVKAAVD